MIYQENVLSICICLCIFVLVFVFVFVFVFTEKEIKWWMFAIQATDTPPFVFAQRLHFPHTFAFIIFKTTNAIIHVYHFQNKQDLSSYSIKYTYEEIKLLLYFAFQFHQVKGSESILS